MMSALLFLNRAEGFTSIVPSTTTTSSACCTNRRPSSSLYMVAKKKNSKKATKATTSGSAGGFGSSTASVAASKAAPQVRSVSGHTGSGTKPLRNAANTFDALRKEFGKDACRDVYVRAPLNDPLTFWFVGKVAIRLGQAKGEEEKEDDNNVEITPQMAILSQKRLILEYAKHQLRPQNLGGKFSKGQELWLAPGDSEMEVIRNLISLEKVSGSSSDLPTGFNLKNNVGFNPEIYVGDEQQKGGLRVQRDPETGDPIKEVFDVNESA